MFKHLDAKPRLLISVLGSLLIYFLIPNWLQPLTRIIISWNFGVICFLTLVWLMMSHATPKKMRSQAQRQDESRWIILMAVVIASCTSLLAIIFMLSGSKHFARQIMTFHIALALFTIAAAWLLINTMFALHYAHLYYQALGDRHALNQTSPLEFPAEKMPDYGDFLYFSFGIGMTFQVADVQINSRLIRRFALIHQVLSFFFNTLILALGINILASII